MGQKLIPPSEGRRNCTGCDTANATKGDVWVLLYAPLNKSLRSLALPELRSLAGNSTMETTNVRAIAIEGRSEMVALQTMGRWTRRAPRKAQVDALIRATGDLWCAMGIRPSDRIGVQRSCMFSTLRRTVVPYRKDGCLPDAIGPPRHSLSSAVRSSTRM